MRAMREDSSKIGSGLLRGMSEGQEAEGDPEEEGGVKATIPEGEHPFDYLFEGHQFLNGRLLTPGGSRGPGGGRA